MINIMKKKIFSVVLKSEDPSKTETIYYAANDSKDVLHVLPEGREVVAVTFGPEISIL